MSHAYKKQTTMENSIDPLPGPQKHTESQNPLPDGSKEDGGQTIVKDQAKVSAEKSAAKDMGSRWCPEEMEIFFNCKLNMALSLKSLIFINSNFSTGFQKYGCDWETILLYLH